MQLFIILLVSGILLIAIEIFVPGAVLGTLGALSLLGAIIVAFGLFGPLGGALVAAGVVLLAGLVVALWVRYFPRSAVGRKMTVSIDLASAKGVDDTMGRLVGRTGVASSDLRPGGYATIDNRRVDVVTQGEMISRGRTVRVIKVESNRVVVAEPADT